ncbi:polymer-forming cytoskeletal protein [Tuberibacillus calidus]|uniref:polymer-forming cytoskeletal protein n=1 Tax=Tuberibacillus calidus TaxID=340097 RepID=UPI00040A2EB5|nr:polymer-forming cytoskeletal protein [Tuberibacillus calidus]
MRMENNHDLIISGTAKAAGGKYRRVEISGSATVSGDLMCDYCRISGSGKTDGDVKVKIMKVSGTSHHFGNVEAQAMDVSGACRVDGRLACEDLKASGSLKVDKHFTGEKTEVNGTLTIKGNCASEHFTIKGSFKIGEMLNADTIEIMLYQNASAKEIGGSTIQVRKEHKGFSLSKLFNGLQPMLSADVIEGDDISLENTKARVVRGKNVHIGPGCMIDLVEYYEELTQDQEAEVKSFKKL